MEDYINLPPIDKNMRADEMLMMASKMSRLLQDIISGTVVGDQRKITYRKGGSIKTRLEGLLTVNFRDIQTRDMIGGVVLQNARKLWELSKERGDSIETAVAGIFEGDVMEAIELNSLPPLKPVLRTKATVSAIRPCATILPFQPRNNS